MVNAAVFADVETTGLDCLSCSVISLGAVAACTETGETLSTFYQFARPESKKFWTKEAEAVHGISWDNAQSFQPQMEMMDNFLTWANQYAREDGHPIPFWYHAWAGFDWRFILMSALKCGSLYSLYKLFRPPEVHSTMYLCRRTWGRRYSVALNKVCDQLQIPLKHHDALSDAQACKEIWRKLELESLR